MRRVLGRTPAEVMVDRGYSNAKVENWAVPLFERNRQQVFDFHPNNRGVTPGPIKGTQWRDGLLLISDRVTKHPSIPTRSPQESREVKEARAEAVAKRHAFSFGFEDWNPERGTVLLVGPGSARSGALREPSRVDASEGCEAALTGWAADDAAYYGSCHW